MKSRFDRSYWENKYKTQNTGWDIGEISTPIKTYIDQLANKDLKILIPGGGNSHEAAYLFKKGFKNLFVIDIAEQPLKFFSEKNPNFPNNHLIRGDFFKLEDTFDLIIEQTFFCALDPTLRTSYVDKMYKLLGEKGKLVGLLFDFKLTSDGPPFGGNKLNYIELFSSKFNLKTMENCYNSIKPRDGKELFFIFEKK